MRFVVALTLFTFPAALSAQEAKIFEPGAKLKIEAEGEGGGEGPAWHPKKGVFTSGDDGHLHLLGLDGKQSIFRKNAGTNGLLFDSKGNLVSCDSAPRSVSRTDLATGKVTLLTDKYEGKRYNNPNDLTIDSQGRIYFSDPRYGPRDGMEIRDAKGRTIEGVYRIDPENNKVARIIGRELERPNGLLVSADDKWLYVADNNNSTLEGARTSSIASISTRTARSISPARSCCMIGAPAADRTASSRTATAGFMSPPDATSRMLPSRPRTRKAASTSFLPTASC